VPHPDLVVGELPPPRRVPFEGWAGDMRLDQVADAGALLALLAFPGALERVDDPFAWEPQYGRPAEAQARWEAEHRRPLPHSSGSHG
jgi:hypothetical protein